VLPGSPTFDVCWMNSINGGMQWSTLIGCFLIFYCYLFSRGEVLWNVLVSPLLIQTRNTGVPTTIKSFTGKVD
jgi:hypothetical protein